MRTHTCAQRGFTLLELIVVLAVFGVMAAMAYGGLSSMLHARTHIEAVFERTQAFQRAFWVMRDDMNNGVWRPILNGESQQEAALQLAGNSTDLEFTRLGWSNPMDLPRSTLERVGYMLQGNHLMRRQWPELDRAPRTQPNDAILLEGVTAVSWRFLDNKFQWHDAWPVPSQMREGTTLTGVPPPRAVEVQLQTSDWGEIVLEFAFGPLAPLSNRT